jgi:hypothetical protein
VKLLAISAEEGKMCARRINEFETARRRVLEAGDN